MAVGTRRRRLLFSPCSLCAGLHNRLGIGPNQRATWPAAGQKTGRRTGARRLVNAQHGGRRGRDPADALRRREEARVAEARLRHEFQAQVPPAAEHPPDHGVPCGGGAQWEVFGPLSPSPHALRCIVPRPWPQNINRMSKRFSSAPSMALLCAGAAPASDEKQAEQQDEPRPMPLQKRKSVMGKRLAGCAPRVRAYTPPGGRRLARAARSSLT